MAQRGARLTMPSRSCWAKSSTLTTTPSVSYGRSWRASRHSSVNAMTSPQFVSYLERKLQEHGVRKVVPDDQTLELMFRREYLLEVAEEHIRRVWEKCRTLEVLTPDGLREQVSQAIRGTATPWDAAVRDIARRAVHADNRSA